MPGHSCVVRQSGRNVVAVATLALLVAAAGVGAAADDDFAARVDRVLAKTPLIDGHNDLPWELRDGRRARWRRSTSVRHDENCCSRRRRALDDGHPAPARGPRRRAVLVGLGAGRAQGRRRGPDDARTDRRRPSHGRARTPTTSRWPTRAADIARIHKLGQDRLADRHRGRALDRQLAGELRQMYDARRPLHDADALRTPTGPTRRPTRRSTTA